jgi:hypothetical protein
LNKLESLKQSLVVSSNIDEEVNESDEFVRHCDDYGVNRRADELSVLVVIWHDYLGDSY